MERIVLEVQLVTYGRSVQAYNDAASSYDEILVPANAARPAQRLLRLVELTSEDRLLDVGSGTGVVLRCAREAVGDLLAVGIDPAIETLRLSASRIMELGGGEMGQTKLACASLPNLPFQNGTFDVVVASFVLSHVPCLDSALVSIRNVLRSGGRLGASSWGALDDPYRELWNGLLRQIVDTADLDRIVAEILPHEETLESPEVLLDRLRDCGFAELKHTEISYPICQSIDGFIRVRSELVPSRVAQWLANKEQWMQFIDQIRSHLSRSGEKELRYDVQTHLVTAVAR